MTRGVTASPPTGAPTGATSDALSGAEPGARAAEPAAESPEAFVARVGERVRLARQRKGLARRVLSERSGVSQRYLAQLEGGQGNISIALLFRIAGALDHRVEWLVGEEDPWRSESARFTRLYRAASPERRRRVAQILEPARQGETRARRLCLIGLRGAGKSTLGPRLARTLALPFVELNAVIEEQGGIAVNEIIAFYGQEGYRQLERRALERVADTHDAVVLAVAGGIVAQPETFGYLLERFHCIWLRAAPEEHMQRVRAQGDERPMAGNPRAMEELESILRSREALYARAETVVDTSGRTLDESEADLGRAVEALGLGA